MPEPVSVRRELGSAASLARTTPTGRLLGMLPGPKPQIACNFRRTPSDFAVMTDQEIHPFLGKAVRVTLADRRVLAGVLHAGDDHGHGHRHYEVVSDAIREGGEPTREMIHGGDQIATIEDASGDPAATA